ncbi:MAG: amidophosphoribosyltransferase [Oscillospiraceae bacterium]|nr:amidophosphoribosyltransferase [Oscillospiraceae bacterium]
MILNNRDKLREECGVFGIFTHGSCDVVPEVYHALHALQHRGQESCGMALSDDGVITGFKDTGLVDEVFTPGRVKKIGQGQMAIGHCRYGTYGGHTRENAQPLVVRHIKGGMALCFNGNLTNTDELREELELSGAIFHSQSDIEVIAYVITRERLTAPSIQEAVSRAMDRLRGAYSLLIMSPRKLIAVRDPFGFRPLSLGRRGDEYLAASETCAFDILGARFLREIRPGEILTISDKGLESNTSHCQEETALCVFEFIYFARPDSVVEGSGVHTARKRAGAFLASARPAEADVVIGVPDSGLDAALGFAEKSGIPYGVGFIKSKYIARTFIKPTQAERENALRIKLSVISDTVRDKRVVLVDDSIVRGTTSARIVRLLREAGAREVHMRLSSPPFLYPCYFGTDIDSAEHLIANNHSVEDIRALIGADSLGYLPAEALHKLAENSGCGFCDACFTGRYPVAPPANTEFSKFDRRIHNGSK